MATIRRSMRETQPIELTPAEELALMSGCYLGSGLTASEQDARAWNLPGAFELFQARHPRLIGTSDDPLRGAWARSGAMLTAEAQQHGFRPYYVLRGGAWTSAEQFAEHAWREAFFAGHVDHR